MTASPPPKVPMKLPLALARCLALFALIAGLSASPASALQTDTRGLHALPAPGPLTIDGDLKDWDLSGQTLMCYDVATLRDTNGADVNMMYDSSNLYVAFHFKTPNPMRNHHDPRYQANKGWAADSVQLRIRTDRCAHVTAWDYVDKNEPAIQITYGTNEKPLGGPEIQLYQTSGWKLEKGAEMAFKRDADGKGYIQEMKLPWAILAESKRYTAGDTFDCGIEMLWGGADWPESRYADNLAPGVTSREFFWTSPRNWGPVTLEPKGHIKLPPPAWEAELAKAKATDSHGPIPVSYNLPRDGVVTIAIDDLSGKRLRNLLPPSPRKKGANTEYWDGKDDSGFVVEPGKYAVKGIVHDPIHLKYALSFANPGNPTWPTSDNRGAFYGDHTAPVAVATGGGKVALACPLAEAGQALIVCDSEGQRQWGQANRVFAADVITSLATDGKTLWVTSDGKKAVVYRDELATGLFSPWNRMGSDDQGHQFKVLDLEISQTPAIRDSATGAWTHNLTAISLHGGDLAASLALDNCIQILNAETGDFKQTIPVASPQSVAYTADGGLLVLSGGKIVRLAVSGATTPFTAGVYLDGRSLAVDAAGKVYLSVRGADQNVKVFSTSGMLVREIGAKGGRPSYGRYNAQAMLNPAQIAVDDTNRLWVTEENWNPKRTSVWDTKTGALLKDLAGTTTYCGAGALNPDDPSMGFADDTVYQIDWKAGTSKAVYSLGRRNVPNDLFPPKVMDIVAKVATHGKYTYVYARDGATTVFDGQDWRSASSVGQVKRVVKKAGLNPNIPADAFDSPLFDGHDGDIYAWSDRNGDGLVQGDELAFAQPFAEGKPLKLRRYYWGSYASKNGDYAYIAEGTQSVARFDVNGYTACGAPIYDIAHPDILPVGELLGKGNGEGMIACGDDGHIYVNQDPILGLDNTGKTLGTYPNPYTSVHGSHNAGAAHPGYVIGPSSFLGVANFGQPAGEIFDLNGNLGENYLFTNDGLLIQTLFKDVRAGFDIPNVAVRGQSMDTITGGSESFGGNFIKTRDGHVYLTIGTTDARVLEVEGLNTIDRVGGSVTVTQAQRDEAARLAATTVSTTSQAKVYEIARATPGKAQEWPELTGGKTTALAAVIDDSFGTLYGRVAARYDDEALTVAYAVNSRNKAMRNAGQDEHLLFKTGDAVDIMVGPEPQDGLKGDTRLLMTIKQGSPIAVINVKYDSTAPKSLHYDFTSPARKIGFDRVQTVTGVQIATSPSGDGYIVIATIPWKVLGITPKSGLKLRGDFGVLFADNGGTTTVSRQYWSNKETGLVSDIPGEGDIAPTKWGIFTLK